MWNPRKEEGHVSWEPSYETIDMEHGEWLVLARTNYLLNNIEQHCRSEGWFYKSKNKPSVSERKIMAVRSWESFRKGEGIPFVDFTKVLNYLKIRLPNSLENFDFDTYITHEIASKHIPNLPNEYWYDVFTAVSADERSYIRAMLRRGEKITKAPRIRLSTIHAAKGGEADNVILLTDISSRVYKSFQDNPDDESRVFYVGLTRAKENLYLIEPQTQKYFPL